MRQILNLALSMSFQSCSNYDTSLRAMAQAHFSGRGAWSRKRVIFCSLLYFGRQCGYLIDGNLFHDISKIRQPSCPPEQLSCEGVQLDFF